MAKWRSRFGKSRLEGLTDEPRPGRLRTVSHAKVEHVVAAALEQAPAQEFLRFLKLIGTAVPQDLELHLVLDNYATIRPRRFTSGCSGIRGSICISSRRARGG